MLVMQVGLFKVYYNGTKNPTLLKGVDNLSTTINEDFILQTSDFLVPGNFSSWSTTDWKWVDGYPILILLEDRINALK